MRRYREVMELARIRPVFAHKGPYATVYLAGGSPGEDAAERIRLRWNALRARLEGEGAATETLVALDEHLDAGVRGEQQADGRVLVAAGDDVQLAEPWDAALGVGDAAHWGVAPELGAYVRELAGGRGRPSPAEVDVWLVIPAGRGSRDRGCAAGLSVLECEPDLQPHLEVFDLAVLHVSPDLGDFEPVDAT
jgi:hypothetical protein